MWIAPGAVEAGLPEGVRALQATPRNQASATADSLLMRMKVLSSLKYRRLLKARQKL
jgi:hypothetical protein